MKYTKMQDSTHHRILGMLYSTGLFGRRIATCRVEGKDTGEGVMLQATSKMQRVLVKIYPPLFVRREPREAPLPRF